MKEFRITVEDIAYLLSSDSQLCIKVDGDCIVWEPDSPSPAAFHDHKNKLVKSMRVFRNAYTRAVQTVIIECA